MLARSTPELKEPVFGVRHQKSTQRCVGYALAALIDIQRNLQWLRASGGKALTKEEAKQICRDIVSADMLYRMAYFHDRYPDLNTDQGVEGIRSLRSAIKGFYHHGACLDWPKATRPTEKGRWQSTTFLPDSPDDESFFPNVEQAKAARSIGLGAYFRLASVLNHYHAALNDAEAVLCTANIHDGWASALPENDGKIAWPPKQGKWGTHAVVLTGYDKDGFHVLNSWGAEWGGYKAGGHRALALRGLGAERRRWLGAAARGVRPQGLRVLARRAGGQGPPRTGAGGVDAMLRARRALHAPR